MQHETHVGRSGAVDLRKALTEHENGDRNTKSSTSCWLAAELKGKGDMKLKTKHDARGEAGSFTSG